MFLWRNRALLIPFLVMLLSGACAQEQYPAWLWAEQHPAPADGGAPPEAAATQDPILCNQARAQALPARLVAMSASANVANTVSETDIFQSFTSICHQCHMGPVTGFTFPATVADFGPTVMSDGIIQHVTGAVCPTPAEPGSPNDPMPPCSSPNGGTYSKRPA